jgi:hypothetical protein
MPALRVNIFLSRTCKGVTHLVPGHIEIDHGRLFIRIHTPLDHPNFRDDSKIIADLARANHGNGNKHELLLVSEGLDLPDGIEIALAI